MNNRFLQKVFFTLIVVMGSLCAQLVTDPLPYAAIANPLPDTMDQLYRDSVNLQFSPIRINQAGYRPQDKKFFYYIGSDASSFTVIDQTGATVGSGTLTSTGKTTSGQLKIKASNNAQLVSGGDTRYQMLSPVYSGSIFEGVIPDLSPGTYHIVIGNVTSAKFVINEQVYSWVRDALLKFYGVNRCGDSQSWFHAGCHLKDSVTGGWHDCGDHLKEGATMSYTAAVLGLAAAVFADRDADVYSANQGITQTTDGIPDMLYEAKHGADFILQSYTKAQGQVGKMITSMGGFGGTASGVAEDHSWWGRPENQDKMSMARGGPPRPARCEPTSDYLGKYAANLAFVSKKIRPYNTPYADSCLQAAKAIYAFTLPRLNSISTAAYNGATIVTDDVAFGCIALLWATGERKYLDDLCFDKTIGAKASATFPKLFQGGLFTNNDPLFSKTSANTDWASTQTHVLWGFYRLILEDKELCVALGLTEQERLGLIEKTMVNLMANLSSIGLGSEIIPLPDGVLWVPSMVKYDLPWFTMHTQMEWVWNRYQAGNITDMYYYYDIATRIQGVELPNTPASTNWKADEVKTVLIRMLDYMFGVNPWDISMVYGVGAKNYNHPHHRAANPEGKNVPGAFYRYTPPVGALQGGYMPKAGEANLYDEFYNDYMHAETGIDGTTNMLMPVVGLAKKEVLGPPSGTVKTLYVGCDNAIVDIRQTKYGTATIRYGTENGTQKSITSDSAGVQHQFVLSGLTSGTAYTFDVVVTDAFGRDSVLKYRDQDNNLVNFSFTTLKECPANAEITNVKVCKVTSDSAEIFWYTPNGEFDSRVVYGEQRPPATVQVGDVSGHPVKFHYVKIGNLKEKTTYYFYVESENSTDDNQGRYYSFTTPVEFVKFDVRTLQYMWGAQPGIGVNIVNQDSKAYDSLELRLYFRDKEGFEKDLGARIDILVLYREDGFQDTVSGALRDAIWKNLATQKPVKMPDTYDETDDTYAYYLTIPLWELQMRSQSRIRMDVIFDHWEQTRLEDLMNEAPEHKITDKDWSFGPHFKSSGDPMDFPGVPSLPKDAVDASYWTQPINYYVTIYRKNEYVWGYSPSQEEQKTKKTQYAMTSQVTSPLINPTADYVFYKQTQRSVDVSGWFTIEPTDGALNDIWVNGVRQQNISSLFHWSEVDKRFNFTIPVPVQNGKNNVDITLFVGAGATCEECYGCAVSNHSFYLEFQGAKQYPSTLLLKDTSMNPVEDTAKIDTTSFYIVVSDPNGNQDGAQKDTLYATVTNPGLADSIRVLLFETGDSTGIFQSLSLIAVVDKQAVQTGPSEIAMSGGDKIWITYIDPTDPTDFAEVVLASRADFPVANTGALYDDNGDGMVDKMVVNYTIALKTEPDSISFHFPSATDKYTAKNGMDLFSVQGTQVTVTLNGPLPVGITGFTSSKTVLAKSYLLYSGKTKTTAFILADSIGPVLTGQAVLFEKTATGNDTMMVTFSEAVPVSAIKDSVLLLRRAGVDFPVKVISIMSTVPGTYTMKIIADAFGVTIASGDSLWLNPNSLLTDLSGNRAHPQNRAVPVVLKVSVPRVTYAYYQDTDFNGIIDQITVGFSKTVAADQLTCSFTWNPNKSGVVDNSKVSMVPGSSSAILLAIDTLLTGSAIKTGGVLYATIVHRDFPGDTIFADVADSAAPVIAAARFLPNRLITTTGTDTLVINFSEPVPSVTGIEAFNLQGVTGGVYSFSVSANRYSNGQEYRFIGFMQGVAYPDKGDSIWLQPRSKLADNRGTIQNAEKNRHAPLVVGKMPYSVDILIGPNPFDPFLEKVTVTIKTNARVATRVDSVVQVTVYDAVGNTVQVLFPERNVDGSLRWGVDGCLFLIWNGENRQGRKVGNGTYLFFIKADGVAEKRYIGVKRLK